MPPRERRLPHRHQVAHELPDDQTSVKPCRIVRFDTRDQPFSEAWGSPLRLQENLQGIPSSLGPLGPIVEAEPEPSIDRHALEPFRCRRDNSECRCQQFPPVLDHDLPPLGRFRGPKVHPRPIHRFAPQTESPEAPAKQFRSHHCGQGSIPIGTHKPLRSLPVARVCASQSDPQRRLPLRQSDPAPLRRDPDTPA